MKSEQGFTLAEMLVTLILLALIAAYSTSALQVFSNVRRIEANIDARTAEAAAMRSIRVSLTGLRRIYKGDEQGNLVLDFSGTRTNVNFVAPLDVHLERGGLYHITFSLDSTSNRLGMRYQLHRAGDEIPVENVFMLDNVTNLGFRYSADGIEWEEQWNSPESLPALVEVQLGTSRSVIAIAAAQ